MPLPSRADRQKLIQQAHLVLAEASTVAHHADQTLALASTNNFATPAASAKELRPSSTHPQPAAAAHSQLVCDPQGKTLRPS